MKILLKKIANILTVAVTLLLVAGLGYALAKHESVADIISEVSFCYVAIAAFNYMIFGAATLWHLKKDM